MNAPSFPGGSQPLWSSRARRLLADAALLLNAIGFSAIQEGPSLLGVGQGSSVTEKPAARAVRQDFKAPGPPQNGPAPFLTTAVDVQMEQLGQFSAHLVFPTKDKIDAPFYDVPFAVHVPFEVPFEGGSVRVFFDVNIVWDEPERALQVYEFDFKRRTPLFRGSSRWTLFDQGLYRVDNAPIPPESVTWEIDAKQTTAFTARTDALFPLLLNGDTPQPNRSNTLTTGLDLGGFTSDTPRRPFGPEGNQTGGRFTFALTRPVVFRPAKPGWYVLWFTLAPHLPSWPVKPLRADDTLRARIFVHTMVSRRDRISAGEYFTWPELDYLWDGVEKKPERLIDPTLIRLHTVEIPVKFQRDGWVFAGAKITTEPDAEKMLGQTLANADRESYQANDVKAETRPTAKGVALSYHVDIFRRDKLTDAYQPPPIFGHTMKWDAEFPSDVPDGSVAEIAIAGSAESTGAPEEVRRPIWDRRDAVPFWIDAETTRLSAPRDPFRLQDRLLTGIANSIWMDRAKYLDRWAWRLDDETARYWLPASDANPPKPEDGGRKIYRYYADLFHPEDAAEPIDMRRILYEDRGPQPLFSFKLGPWNVDALYRRKKDIRPEATAASISARTEIAQEKDPFWEWYPTYSRMVNEKLTAAQQAMAEAAPLGVVIQDRERRARKLLQAVQAQAELSQGDSVFRSSGALATVSEQTFTRMVNEARKLSQQARDDRAFAVRKMDEATRAYTDLEEEIGRAYDRYGDRHPELLLWRRGWRIEKAMKRYAFATATSDLGVFRTAVEESRLADLDPEVRLYEARILRDTSDWPGAVYALRRAIAQTSATDETKDRAQVAPDILAVRRQAEDMLQDIECAILRSALEKSQGALKQARKNFYRYIEERGFSEKDRNPVAGKSWWTAAFSPLYVGREEAWAIFTTGVTGAVSGILGKPGAEADALAVYETQMTTAYLGLQTIIRLRQRGLTMQEINTLTTERILKELPLRSVTGAPFSGAQAAQLGVAVREALKLPEVQALVVQDEDTLRRTLGQGYWNPRDVTDTWAEWVGDITSPKNLLQNLLPMSVGTVGGVPQGVRLWSASRAEAVAALKAVNAAEGGTVVLARYVGIERALQAVRGTERGERLAELMARAHSRYEQLGLMDKAIWQGGKAVAGMALGGLAAHGLEKVAGKEAAFAGQMLVMFAGDEQLLAKFAYGNGQNPAVFAKLIETQYIPVLRNQVRDLRSVEEEIGVWQKVLTELRAGKELEQLEAKTQEVVRQRLATGPSNLEVPNGSPGHDSKIALQAAAEGVENNTDNGAANAAATLGKDAQSEIETIATEMKEAETVAAKLAAAPPTPTPAARPPPVDLDFAPDEFVNVRMPPSPQPGSTWARAEQAMAEGRFEDAEGLWTQLIRESQEAAVAGRPLTKHDLPLEILELKLQAARGRGAPPPPTAVGATSAAQEVSVTEAEAAIQRAQTRISDRVNATPTAAPGETPARPASAVGKGSSGSVDIADDFVVKEVAVGNRLTPNVMRLQAQAEGEMVGARLNRALGGNSPGVHVKVLEWDGANPKRIAIVSRTVDGPLLNELKPEEIYALRRELARHRLVSLLLGDYDRKLDNYKVAGGNRVFAFDAGQADVRGRIAEGENELVDGYTFLEGLFGRDHWYRGSFTQHVSPTPGGNRDFLNKVFFAESMLTYEDAVPALESLKPLLANEAKGLKDELRAAYTQLYQGTPLEGSIEQFVNEAAATMQERAAKLDTVLRGLNARNGVTLPPTPSAQIGAPRHDIVRAPWPLAA